LFYRRFKLFLRKLCRFQ